MSKKRKKRGKCETEKKQDRFVKAIVDHKKSPTAARDIAGYSDRTHVRSILRPDGPVYRKVRAALAKKGITIDTWANEYADGLRLAKTPGSRDLNLNAHAQYQKQLGQFFSDGPPKETPQVAVQINNTNGSDVGGDDPARAERLERQMQALIAAIEAEEERRRSGEVHAERPGVGDAGACPGVVDVVADEEEPLGGGEP